MAVAIATGSAVAQGQSPVKLKLANRLERKRLAVFLEEDVPVDEPRTRSSPYSSPARKSLTCGDKHMEKSLMIMKEVQGVVGLQQNQNDSMSTPSALSVSRYQSREGTLTLKPCLP